MPIPSAPQDDSTNMSSSDNTNEELKKSANTAKTGSVSSMTAPTDTTWTFIDANDSSHKINSFSENMDENRKKLFRGGRYVSERVALTLGHAGASAVIESNLRPFHKIVDDGRSVAESIWLDDPVENMGANIMKEVAVQADKESADGTTTATVLVQAIIDEAEKQKVSGIKLKRELDEALLKVIEAIDAKTKEISVEDIYDVALTSSGDEEISHLFKEIYVQIGKDGIIELDNSNLPTTHYEITDGVRLRNAGSLGAYSFTEPGKAIFKNPKILISKEKITSVNQIEELVGKLAANGINELVIYCDEIDPSVSSRLALTHLQGGFKTLIIPSPTLWKDWLFEDFALLTGATPVDYANGKTFKNLTLNDLGTCEKIITTKDETRLLGTKDVSEHIASLKEAGRTDDQQLIRAAWLGTKAAILKVGAKSESELSHRRAKVQDAIGATHLALEGGVVPGGGLALKGIESGSTILDISLAKPYEQICKNAEVDNLEIAPNIVDAAKVTKNSVSAAVSIAGTLLTTKIAIPMRRETNKDPFQ